MRGETDFAANALAVFRAVRQIAPLNPATLVPFFGSIDQGCKLKTLRR
jgi:hypothetical protein